MSNQKCRHCGKLNPPESRFCNGCGSTLSAALVPADGLLSPGAVLRGSYVVEDVIGEGGMGVVYLCHHKTLGTRYALKVLDAKLARMEVLRNRFLAEAKIQATVMHPHIVRVMDVIDSDGILAIVMEHVDGKALDEILEQTKCLTPKIAISVALVILDAVGYAHHEGIVHRDLKPSNVMIEREFALDNMWKGVKVMDFGIAKLLQEEEQRTMTGVKMGTPRYMAPEQIENAREVDARADIYAIGVTLYELLCGRTPFEELREFELLKAQLTQNPPMMRNYNASIPERLEAVVMKALQKEREKRYPNAESFQKALLDLDNNENLNLVLHPQDFLADVQINQKLQRKIGKAINKNKAKNETKSPIKSTPQPELVEDKLPPAQDAFARTEFEQADNAQPQPQDLDKSSKAKSSQVARKSPSKVRLASRSFDLRKIEAQAPSTGAPQAIDGAQDPASIQKKRRSRALLWVLLVLLILLAVGLFYRKQHSMHIVSQNNAPPAVAPADNALPDPATSFLTLSVKQTPQGRMTYIPKTLHWISTRQEGELALKQQALPAFYIDQTEVSYYHYLQCVQAQACPPLAQAPSSLALPVTQVGYGSAQAFCKWAAKRLPTAIEWEAAARYGGDDDGLNFVNVDCQSTNFAGSKRDECFNINPNRPEPVYSRPQGANPGHIHHLLGNVREWTSTSPDSDKQKYITKGGSYKSKRNAISISANQSQSPNTGDEDLGWRCAL